MFSTQRSTHARLAIPAWLSTSAIFPQNNTSIQRKFTFRFVTNPNGLNMINFDPLQYLIHGFIKMSALFALAK